LKVRKKAVKYEYDVLFFWWLISLALNFLSELLETIYQKPDSVKPWSRFLNEGIFFP